MHFGKDGYLCTECMCGSSHLQSSWSCEQLMLASQEGLVVCISVFLKEIPGLILDLVVWPVQV